MSSEIRDTLCGETYILEGMRKEVQPRDANAEGKTRTQEEADERMKRKAELENCQKQSETTSSDSSETKARKGESEE